MIKRNNNEYKDNDSTKGLFVMPKTSLMNRKGLRKYIQNIWTIMLI